MGVNIWVLGAMSSLLLESGDRVLLESGNALLLEDHVQWLARWPLPDLVEHVGWLLGQLGSDAVDDLTDGAGLPPVGLGLAPWIASAAAVDRSRTFRPACARPISAARSSEETWSGS
jgi:hypothetical protein